MPDQAGLLSVLAGVVAAAVFAMVRRHKAERQEIADQLHTTQLAVDVIRSSEQLLQAASAQPPGGKPSWIPLLEDDERFRSAARRLASGSLSSPVTVTLAEVERARQQVLLAMTSRDAEFLRIATRGLGEAVEGFAAATSVMVRLA
ncbi:hypothetical protein [Actinoplanes sp. NPDC051851]|uniref:hypothetical protein n=1 Tax=Actinoplanes sp. NPDC051851 TaxID=3154753 RepID=UPI00341D0F4A